MNYLSKKKIYFVISVTVFVLMSCVNKRAFDVILYQNTVYDETLIEEIEVVSSRLEIKEKFYEIGVIKASEITTLSYIKKIAAKNGADIVINEGNLNYTLAKYQEIKREKRNEKETIKT